MVVVNYLIIGILLVVKWYWKVFISNLEERRDPWLKAENKFQIIDLVCTLIIPFIIKFIIDNYSLWGAELDIVGCIAASLTSTTRCQLIFAFSLSPSLTTPNFLLLPNVSWEAKLPKVKNHSYKGFVQLYVPHQEKQIFWNFI